MSEPAKVMLGRHELPVYDQPWAYMFNRVEKRMLGFFTATENVEADSVLRALGSGVYEFLCACIPQLAKRMPVWEFHGYQTREAWEAGDELPDDPDEVPAPSIPQVLDAIATVLRVNRIDELRRLTGVVDPKLVRGFINTQIAQRIERLEEAGLPTLPSTNGTSASTSSTSTSPTSMESAG